MKLDNPTLSVVTVCDKPISKEFYLLELLKSVYPIADEIVIIDAYPVVDDNSEVSELLFNFVIDLDKEDPPPIRVYQMPWSENGKKNTYWMWKSAGIYQATCDYVLRLDADEVLLDTQENYDKIRKAMGLNHDCYTAKVKHFWKDYNHILTGRNSVDGGNPIYERRNYLFKNCLGYYENQFDICDLNGDPISADRLRHTGIEVFHYGGVRSNKVFLDKKNQIEKAYHDDWIDLIEWNWETSGQVIEYNGVHPKAMAERLGYEI